MSTYYKTRGFIFKKDEKGEFDKIFSVFSEDFGRVEIKAKAIRKLISKLRAGIDTPYFSEVEFVQGKNYKTLTDVQAINKYKNIYGSREKMLILNKIFDAMDKLIKGEEKDEKIFSLILWLLDILDSSDLKSSKYNIVYNFFMWNFFSELGYCPQVEKCARCGFKLIPYYLYFSNKDGGVICKKCAQSFLPTEKINSDIIKVLRLILKKNWDMLSKMKVGIKSQELLDRVLNGYYLYMLNNHY